MKLIVTKNYEELSKKAYQEFTNILSNIENPRIGLATGSSPLGLYKELIESVKENHKKFKNFSVTNLDEYIGLDESNPNKYSTFLYENVLNEGGFDNCNIDLILDNENTIEEECERYHNLLSNSPLNLQILGLGANCHIGFNEPGTLFDSTTHVVKLNEKTRNDNARFFDSVEDVPTHAITVGIKDIMSADNILLVASGKEKAEAVKRMIHGAITEECPASILRVHKSVTIIVDEAAASLL